MKWTPKEKVRHKMGRWFALLPTRMKSGEYVWLEYYYYSSYYCEGDDYSVSGWNTIRTTTPLKLQFGVWQ